jgi:hypothetical protein
MNNKRKMKKKKETRFRKTKVGHLFSLICGRYTYIRKQA